jgi:hypothetical protein
MPGVGGSAKQVAGLDDRIPVLLADENRVALPGDRLAAALGVSLKVGFEPRTGAA